MVRRLFSSIASYMAIAMLERGVNFALTFVLTYYLLPAEMGKVNLFTTMLAFVLPLVNLYTNGANLLAWEKYRDNFSRYYSSTLLINTIGFVCFGLIVGVLTLFTDFNTGIHRGLLALLPLLAFSESLRLAFTAYAQAAQKLWLFGCVNLTATVSNLILTFVFLQTAQPNHEARLRALVGGAVCTTILVAFFIRRTSLLAKPSKAFIRDALQYGVPLIPHAFGIIVMDISDRFFINHYATKADLGQYGIAYSLASLLALVSGVIMQAWTPRFNALMADDSEGSRLIITRFSLLFVLVFGLFVLLFTTLSPFLFGTLINLRYLAAQAYLPWLALVYVLQAVYFVFSGILFFHRKTVYFMWISLVNIGCNLLLNWWLVPMLGAKGAAISTVISMAIFTVFIANKASRLTPLPWRSAATSLRYWRQ